MSMGILKAIACVSLFLLTAPLASAAKPEAMVRLPGHVLPALAKAKVVAAQSKATADEPLTLTLVLKRDDQAGFDKYLRDVYDPKSPSFQKFLTQSELSDRFGPSRKAYDAVLGYLQSHGFTLLEGSENRLTLTIASSRSNTEHAFRLKINTHTLGERQFFANDTDPQFPVGIGKRVQSVIGLTNLAQPRPKKKGIVKVFCGPIVGLTTASDLTGLCKQQLCKQEVDTCTANKGLEAADLTAVRNELKETVNGVKGKCQEFTDAENCIPPPPPPPPPLPSTAALLGGAAPAAQIQSTRRKVVDETGQSRTSSSLSAQEAATPWKDVDGTGQKIGITAFDTFEVSDVRDYLEYFGVPDVVLGNLSQVHVNGGATPGSNQAEVLLDIDAILATATGATVVVYDAPFTGQGSFQALFNRMLVDDVSIISNSWAYCEDQTTAADVQSIDTILATAAAAGVSVFNAAGDSGSTCLNGSTNVAAVPASSPNATAVGGTSLTTGPAATYGVETWWDGMSDTPPTGMGGFGVSQYFDRPAYQVGFNAWPKRSVPDIAFNSDPAQGVVICQASAGGCPSSSLWGGTSVAAPTVAAATALLNQALGYNLGNLNLVMYPLANSTTFHTAASMGSDFAHVGLGSPKFNALFQAISNTVSGPVDPQVSEVRLPQRFVPADGTSTAFAVVRLRDSLGNTVRGKAVTLTANAGSHAVITPSSGIADDHNGAVVFSITDLTPETIQLTVTDTTDGIVLQQTPTLAFRVPPAASANITASPTPVTANGTATTTITVTLRDALNRPTPGKEIRLSQGTGHSVITGPNPSVTDSNGEIRFTATNLFNETITYTAIDVTDGDLPVPGSAVVTFSNSTNLCPSPAPTPVGQNGYVVTSFATGFIARPLNFGGIAFGGCPGVSTPAFLDDNIFFTDWTGDVIKLDASGGAVTNANRLANVGQTLMWPVVSKAGKLYMARASTGFGISGVIVEINPATGAVVRTLASGLPCPFNLAIDPLSGDLFFDGGCSGSFTDPTIRRIRNPDSATPTLEVYATLPASPNGKISFAPDGTLFVVTGYFNPAPTISRVSGTDGPTTPTVTTVPGVNSFFWVNVAEADTNGVAQSLLTLSNQGLELVDITVNPPTKTLLASNLGGGEIGPDGCLYAPIETVIYRLTDSTGSCRFASTTPHPSITLTPTIVSPNPAQGTAQSFTATFRNIDVPENTPVFLTVTGANPQRKLVRTNANGEAPFTYTAISEGKDTILATATVDNTDLVSNKAEVTWATGKHITFLTLNSSPTGGTPGVPVNVIVSLTDSSVDPVAPIAGVTVNFTLGGAQCSGVTDADGIASCQLAPNAIGMWTLTATFAGSSQFVASTDSIGFNVLVEPSGGIEVCGNCVDEDEDNLPDILDPDCAPTTLTLTKGILGLDLDPSEDKLTLRGTLSATLGSVNPQTQGVTISLVDADGQIACLNIPPGDGWKTNKALTSWRFMDKRDDSLGDPTADERFNLRYDAKKGVFKAQANIKEAELTDAEAGEIFTGISIGERIFLNAQMWKVQAKGKKLVTP